MYIYLFIHIILSTEILLLDICPRAGISKLFSVTVQRVNILNVAGHTFSGRTIYPCCGNAKNSN